MRDRIVRIRVSSEELAALKVLATARGLSISEIMRRSALGIRLPQRSLDRTNIALLTRALGQLGRVGGILNQLAKRANSGKLVGHNADLNHTLSEINELRSHLRGLVA